MCVSWYRGACKREPQPHLGYLLGGGGRCGGGGASVSVFLYAYEYTYTYIHCVRRQSVSYFARRLLASNGILGLVFGAWSGGHSTYLIVTTSC